MFCGGNSSHEETGRPVKKKGKEETTIACMGGTGRGAYLEGSGRSKGEGQKRRSWFIHRSWDRNKVCETFAPGKKNGGTKPNTGRATDTREGTENGLKVSGSGE